MYLEMLEDPCEPECYKCSEHEYRTKCIKEWVEELKDQVYSDKKVDKYKIDRCVLELCAYLNIKFPTDKINIK